MKRIGLLSDTHSFLDENIFTYFKDCDEIWHAGDIGNMEVADRLSAFKPLRAVFGNIDDGAMQRRFPLDLRFNCEGLEVFITHIGGYPGKYTRRVREILRADPPGLYICGHSHILKVIPDKELKLLHINPGACGQEGFHQVKTIVRFTIEDGIIKNLEVVELGKRGAL
ncbi:MAG: metallophosphoesterase family protein [Lewinellaceae bacterium]|nr:metallophosphoesterase family protein [Saprospiraceae bacterium]MCB9336854.1 metallophosphoesterase family protein [Lewinellaceae bacterium]